jgi:tetratricopeptide (TPR) repeat protein
MVTSLITNAVYNNINQVWRRILHKKIGEGLEHLYGDNIDDIIYELAHHYSNTYDIKKAIKYNILSAEKARASFAITQASTYYQKALHFLADMNTKSANMLKAKIFEDLGDCNTLLTDYKKAIQNFECAKKLIDEYTQIIRLYRKIANAYLRSGAYDDAFEAVCAGLKYSNEVQDIEYGRLCLTAADVHTKMNRFNEAIVFCNRAYTNFMQNKSDQRTLAYFYYTKGNVYFSKNAYEDAYNAYEKSLNLFNGTNDFYGISVVLNSMGEVQSNKGNYEKALVFYTRALKLSKKVDDFYGIARAYKNIGFIKYRLEDYDAALQSYIQCLEICDRTALAQIGVSAAESISKIYEEKGDFENAIKYLERSKIFKVKNKA